MHDVQDKVSNLVVLSAAFFRSQNECHHPPRAWNHEMHRESAIVVLRVISPAVCGERKPIHVSLVLDEPLNKPVGVLLHMLENGGRADPGKLGVQILKRSLK